MSRCLNLTRAGEYAIAALARLALTASPQNPVSVEGLARSQKIPRPFLSKILQHCARAGLILTKKGPKGGISLARRAEDITLLSIIEACEGVYARTHCVFYSTRPCSGPDCEVYCPLRKEEEVLQKRLKKTTLADMAQSLKIHPDAGIENAFVGGDQWTRRA